MPNEPDTKNIERCIHWYGYGGDTRTLARAELTALTTQLAAARTLLLESLAWQESERMADRIMDLLCPGWKCETCQGRGTREIHGSWDDREENLDICPTCMGKRLSPVGMAFFRPEKGEPK
jgi:hypothetical protein